MKLYKTQFKEKQKFMGTKVTKVSPKKTIPEIIELIMKEKEVRVIDMANNRGVYSGTIVNTIKKKTMNTKTLSELLESLGEELTIVLSNGKSYRIKIE